MDHAKFTGILNEEQEKQFDTLLTFIGESYKVRSTHINSKDKRFGVEIEEVGESTIYKIEANTIEQLCDSVASHIIKDRVGRPVSETADTSTTFGPFTATASGMGGGMVMTKAAIEEIEKMMVKSFPSFKGPNKTLNELRKEYLKIHEDE